MVAVPLVEEHSTISEVMHEELETPGSIFVHLNSYFYFHS